MTNKHRKQAAKGSFQRGQTAEARSGYRVQSLPKDMAAAIFLLGLYLARRIQHFHPVKSVVPYDSYRHVAQPAGGSDFSEAVAKTSVCVRTQSGRLQGPSLLLTRSYDRNR